MNSFLQVVLCQLNSRLEAKSRPILGCGPCEWLALIEAGARVRARDCGWQEERALIGWRRLLVKRTLDWKSKLICELVPKLRSNTSWYQIWNQKKLLSALVDHITIQKFGLETMVFIHIICVQNSCVSLRCGRHSADMAAG